MKSVTLGFFTSIAALTCACSSLGVSPHDRSHRKPADLLSSIPIQNSISGETKRISNRISQQGPLVMRVPTETELHEWLLEFLTYSFPKPTREKAIREIEKDTFPFFGHLTLNSESTEISFQFYYRNEQGDSWDGTIPIMRGTTLLTYQGLLRQEYETKLACNQPLSICDEPFRSNPPPISALPFPSSIPVKITEIEVDREHPINFKGLTHPPELRRDALKVEIHVTPDNRDDVIHYFGLGWGFPATEQKLTKLLQGHTEAWIEIQNIFSGWVSTHANTLPHAPEDNSGCHATARDFFFEHQNTNNQYASSTEAIQMLIARHYCLLPEGSEPTFGDLLIIPGIHSGRFILKDPNSGRWISFSSFSSSHTPFRFYWCDEDFSGRAFGRIPNFQKAISRTDLYRRCRN